MIWSESSVEKVAESIAKSESTLAKEINLPVTKATNKGDGSPTIYHADWYAKAALSVIAELPEVKALVEAMRDIEFATRRIKGDVALNMMAKEALAPFTPPTPTK